MELRLVVTYHTVMTAQVHANLRFALAINGRLQFLELMMPGDWETVHGRYKFEYEDAMVERLRLEGEA